MATAVADYCAEFKESGVPLQTLVRLSGPNVDCPFVGEFTFTYKTGKKTRPVPVKTELKGSALAYLLKSDAKM